MNFKIFFNDKYDCVKRIVACGGGAELLDRETATDC